MSFDITLPFGWFLDFRTASVEIPQFLIEIELSFEDGDHVLTSSDFELGTLKGDVDVPLIGRITLRYSYDAANGAITVCGTSFPSSDGMALITMPKGMEEQAYVSRTIHRNDAAVSDDGVGGSLWAPRSKAMAGTDDLLTQMVRMANESLINALWNEPDLTVSVRE